ncbi:diaminopimelate decarboxylase [Burkholderia ubonensis]|uniref:diaminopimelate decarboxylase n=1 Tax=Burkholderia ubonensis TaxID=101571 RepID=UPI0009139839|nr:diaminopimelate decarboxylase [Burkholderia ubonensis]OJA40010.1 diaminopimelate decarboxylase [Burkholderia ubonensis]
MNANLDAFTPAGRAPTADWWARDRLHYRDGVLHFCGRDVAELAAAFAEPVFLYDPQRAVDNVARLQRALGGLQRGDFRIHYAMKANRFRPLLSELRRSPIFGIDVCSPEELREALACGFAPARISYTAHGMMPDEAELLAALPDVHVNCDTLSAIALLGSHSPGREIGIRVNPGVGIGYGDSERLSYAGETVTKFGIYAEQFGAALELAARHGLTVTWLHCHAGCGYLDPQLASFERVLDALDAFVARVPGLRGINLGGGLGLPHRATDRPLDLERWRAAVHARFGARPLALAIEPGDFIAKDGGMLVLRVAYVELKRDRRFVGLNGGFNLAIEPAFYDLPCEPVPCVRRPGAAQSVCLAGNINEALDLWSNDVSLPPVEPGDFVALLNAGGYASSMSSNHCLRGQFRELALFDAPPH